MECPVCHEKGMSVLVTTPGAAHLMGGTDILWCENCGTTATTFYHSKNPKLRNIKIPRGMQYDQTRT